MQLVYALEDIPETLRQSLFLAGPTPRTSAVASWRLQMVDCLKRAGYGGIVFIPESRQDSAEKPREPAQQANWEKRCLDLSDAILAWVPRELEHLPAFTTNVEFGRYVSSRKLFYGRPPNAPHTAYLDWLYELECGESPAQTMEDLAKTGAAALAGREAERSGGERFVPIQIWESEMFQRWYASQRKSGNRLDGARVLWSFFPKPGYLLSFMLHVKLWVATENRHKANEFIFSRRDIASVLPIRKASPGESTLESKVVLVREFRSTVHNADSFVRELPGGSNVSEMGDAALNLAVRELQEETGLEVSPGRLVHLGARQLSATTSTHKSYLFLLNLTEDELHQAEQNAERQTMLGDRSETEQTYVEVRRVRELLESGDVDFATLGMILQGLHDFDDFEAGG